jgi:RNA polymerase sigma factor (TIGR02999 family)
MSVQGDEGQVTKLLRNVSNRHPGAQAALIDVVYAELRSIAQRQMSSVGPAAPLQPTALVHEAYLRLFGKVEVHWENRGHFFWAAARAMRDTLVEHARKCASRKRGGQFRRVTLTDDIVLKKQSDELLALDEAIKCLEQEYPDVAKVVVLRFFGGMNHSEVATALGLSEPTVRRRWSMARAWLHKAMAHDGGSPPDSLDHVSAYSPV